MITSGAPITSQASQDIVICFEMDNAREARELQLLEASLSSVATAAREFVNLHRGKVEIVIVKSELSSEAQLQCVREIESSNTDVIAKQILETSDGYFAAKNSVLELVREEQIIIFCDSDCVYEVDFLDRILEGFRTGGVEVVYGKTFPLLHDDEDVWSTAAALCWQFPPLEIGYGGTWPSSRWANNLAVCAARLKANPFPSVAIVSGSKRSRRLQLKLERVLWSQELEEAGVVVSDRNAIAYHRVPSSILEFAHRQYVHGIASAFLADVSGAHTLVSLVGPCKPPTVRAWHLFCLWGRRSITLRQLVASGLYLFISIPSRFAGAAVFKFISVDFKARA